MASLKTITIIIIGLAFVGFATQLGGLASMADTGCRNAVNPAAFPDYNGFSTAAPTGTELQSGRKLSQHYPTKYEKTSRCNIHLAMDWWSVFYQFGAVAFALFAAFTDRMYQARIRLSMLFGVALCWTVLLANYWLPNVIAKTNAIRDAEVFEQDVVQTGRDWVNFVSTRVYIAGMIMSSISYFFFILFGLGEFASK